MMQKWCLEMCPHCKKMRRNNSPYSYVWWHVSGFRMCWKCFDKKSIINKNHLTPAHDGIRRTACRISWEH